MNKPWYLLLPTNVCSLSYQLPPSHSLGLEKILEEFKGIFQEPPKGLPPLKGIEHQIDLILGSLPNKPTYKSNLEEKKEI